MRHYILSTIIVICLFLSFIPFVSASGTIVDKSITLGPGQWYEFSFDADKGEKLSVKIDSEFAVDIFLMEYNNYGEYESAMEGERESFTYLKDGSRESVTKLSYTFTIPNDERYYVIVDNTPLNGASGTQTVDVELTIKLDATYFGLCCGSIIFISLISVIGFYGIFYLNLDVSP